MGAVAGHAVDDDALAAELRPAHAAVLALPAAPVVVDHDALTDPRLRLAHPRPHGGDDAAGLVAADDGPAAAAEAEGLGRIAGGAVGVQIAPAHAGGLDGDDDLAGTGRRVRELAKLQLPLTKEDNAAHGVLLRLRFY